MRQFEDLKSVADYFKAQGFKVLVGEEFVDITCISGYMHSDAAARLCFLPGGYQFSISSHRGDILSIFISKFGDEKNS